MTQIANLTAAIPAAVEPASQRAPLRIPNPLRSGLLSFVATLAVIGAGAAVLNVAVDRGLDTYHDKQVAAFAEPSNDPAYATARAMAGDEETTTGVVTVSAN